MGSLFLVRHGKSEYNEKGLWCGWTDVNLVEDGRAEARKAGEVLRQVCIDEAHVSLLKRTHQTLDEIVRVIGVEDLPVYKHEALNERHYGIHTGKNKWQVLEDVGEEEFRRIRRGWDTPIPEGETLKVVHDRVVPYYEQHIKPIVMSGKNVLVVAHGNTLRALIKHIENLDEEAVADVEVATNEVREYRYDTDKVIGPAVISRNE